MSISNKGPGVDYRLQNLTNALYLDGNDDVVVRTGFAGNIVISGNVNVPGDVTVNSSPEDPVHVHLTELGTYGNLTTFVPIRGNVTVDNFPAFPTNVSISQMPGVTGNVHVYGNISIDQLPGIAINSLPEVEIKNDTGNPVPISANTSVNSNTNPIYVKGTSDTSFFAPTQSDAFGRLRVSNPFTLMDQANRYQDNDYSSNLIVGTSSVGFDANNAAITLTVNTNSGDSVIRETNRVYAYQPGKSLLILQTFTFAAAKTNLTQRAGYYDSANGFYLERAGTTVSFVKRSSVSGSVVETRFTQNQWNINQLASLDLDKSQILWMDIEWLGVGSVRMGFVINGEFVHCHSWHHANSITGVYTTTSCLPIRKEIFNTGATAGSSTMLSICNSVISEGGYTLTGRDFCVGHILGTPVNISNTPTSYTPLISLRLKSNRLGAIVLPTTFTVTPVQQAVYKYQIYTRAITSGGTWISAAANSSVEYNVNPTSLVSGQVALSAFINATNQTTGSAETVQFPFDYQLERNSFVPTCYEVVIVIAASTNNTTAYASINWKEIT